MPYYERQSDNWFMKRFGTFWPAFAFIVFAVFTAAGVYYAFQNQIEANAEEIQAIKEKDLPRLSALEIKEAVITNEVSNINTKLDKLEQKVDMQLNILNQILKALK